MELIDYYNASTARDWTGRVKSFKATGKIGEGLMPILHKSAPLVALFSARGPNIKDFNYQDVDLLKPEILAPGYLLWAAWSPNGTDEADYLGHKCAMVSGTSMAAPHIAGISALIKQKHPRWSPVAIKSALMTTSTVLDRAGRPIEAQQYSDTETMKFVKATPFDYGSGHFNPRVAFDPGFIFDAGYQDYLGFLCTTPGIYTREIMNYTNSLCNYTIGHPSILNGPSITISHLVGTQTVTRTVTNVAQEETYVIAARMDPRHRPTFHESQCWGITAIHSDSQCPLGDGNVQFRRGFAERQQRAKGENPSGCDGVSKVGEGEAALAC